VCDGNSIDVNTSSGSVRGQTLHVLNRKIHQFLNIPYAEPPLGLLRFAPPLPLNAPKQDIIDGTKLGYSCIQRIQVGVNTNEDCLVLNIWTTNVDYSDDSPSLTVLKPVMVYIYGGGLSLGSIFNDHYNASVLATNDVVVVSVNYRVGPLGFLYGADRTAPGNAGFYDQLLALKWVRENIHAFGGDRDQMTIFGQSAGSWSVSAHILSPLSKGLFKRAIMQSGAHMYNRDRPVLSTVEALQKAKQLAKRLNCDQYDYKWLDCICFTDIELIAGVTTNEGTTLGHGLVPEMRAQLTEPLFRKAVHDLGNDYHNIDVDKVCDHYLKDVHTTNSSQLKTAFRLLLGDLGITCPAYHFAKNLAANGHRVYFYQLSFQCKLFDSLRGCMPGHVCHGADLQLCFGHPLRQQTLFSETEYDFSIDVMKMWTNFAKTG
ncbi:unnamed protein product, partial [Medioppia subpectinata]